MNQRQCNEFLEVIIDLGRLMVQYGAEVARVEDAITRICKAYDIKKVEIYASTTLIVCTIKTKDDLVSTTSARVGRSANNLGALEKLNSLSRNICATKPEVSEIRKSMIEIVDSIKVGVYNCLGYVLASGGFTVFFGGNLIDGIVSGGIGVLIYLMDKFFKVDDTSKLIYTMIMCAITGAVAIFLVNLGIGDKVDKIIIGNVMPYIPALALVNATKDMFYRNITTGLFKTIEACSVAMAIAFGFGFSIVLFGGGM